MAYVEREYDKDGRLSDLLDGEYRIWSDAQDILIPRGQSTTNPREKEKVNANTKVHGVIQKGWFNRPHVQYFNTFPNVKIFDEFYLRSWRYDLPLDDPDVDLNGDLGIEELQFEYAITFTEESTEIYGYSQGIASLFYDKTYPGENVWYTSSLRFTDINNTRLEGTFQFVINEPIWLGMNIPIVTGEEIQPGVLPFNVVVNEATLVNGSSKSELFIEGKNDDLSEGFKIDSFTFNVLGGG